VEKGDEVIEKAGLAGVENFLERLHERFAECLP
jgi:hypothetical protein